MSATDENTTNTKNVSNNVEEEENPNNESIISLTDVLEMDASIEQDAEALLGGQNDMICTYPEGYKYRQPLFSCLTCTAETGEIAGLCYGCAQNCHDKHDLVEMYTKRKFCCDCGNSKFKSKCTLFPEKLPLNLMNKYNHNFLKTYCVCKSQYPPENMDETGEPDDMHQCSICEDWFHLNHIYDCPKEVEENLSKLNDEIKFVDLICKGCATKFPFIQFYETKILAAENLNENEQQDVCKLSTFDVAAKQAIKPHSIYFVGINWRDALCRCSKCLEMYEQEDIAFLLDPEDTLIYYDQKRRENMKLKGEVPYEEKPRNSSMTDMVYDLVIKQTNNRDAALTAYLGATEMVNHLNEYFTKLNGKVLTKEDVRECFEELRAKRPRLDPSAKK